MQILDTGELRGIKVINDPGRSGEVIITAPKIKPGKFIRVVPDLRCRDINFLSGLSGHSDRFACNSGDGMFVSKSLLLHSGLLTKKQEKQVRAI